MKKYTLEVGLVQRYEVDLFADSRAEAEAIADEFDFTDETAGTWSFMECDRTVEFRDEDDLTDLLTDRTSFEWQEIETGGGYSHLSCTLEDGQTLCVSGQNSQRIPKNLNEMCNVFILDHEQMAHDITTTTLEVLLDTDRLLDIIATHQPCHRPSVCDTCGRSIYDCEVDSFEAEKILHVLTGLLGNLNETTGNALGTVLQGWRTNSLPTCNRGAWQ